MEEEKKAIIFKSIISHSIKIDFNGGNSIKLFNENNKNDESIINFTEQKTVEWLFKQQLINNLIVEELSGLKLNQVQILTEVKDPILDKERQEIIGDIDAMIIPKLNPEKSVIIEFKRIKIRTDLDNETKINKLKTAKAKGVKQVNKLREFEFHKTFLGIIIQEDSQNIKSSNTILRNAEIDKSVDIYNMNSENKLDEKAGLFYIHLTQPTGEDFRIRNNFNIMMQKRAIESIQLEKNTIAIKNTLINKA